MGLSWYLMLAATASGHTALGCPPTLLDQQTLISPTEAAAFRVVDTPRLLSGMDVYVGHPSKLVQLRGDDWTHKDRYVWDFPAGEDIWIECRYERSGIVLTYHPGLVHRCVYILRASLAGGGTGMCYKAANGTR